MVRYRNHQFHGRSTQNASLLPYLLKSNCFLFHTDKTSLTPTHTHSFAVEVERVSLEVGTQGKLGGQAIVEGVEGDWKKLTSVVNRLAANLSACHSVCHWGQNADLCSIRDAMHLFLAMQRVKFERLQRLPR